MVSGENSVLAFDLPFQPRFVWLNTHLTLTLAQTDVVKVISAPGQYSFSPAKMDIKVDALPGTELKGTVESLGPASGVSYSAVAPHNATGNFTKIVQRLPVRIRIDPDQLDAANLRVGMSVTPKIRIGE